MDADGRGSTEWEVDCDCEADAGSNMARRCCVAPSVIQIRDQRDCKTSRCRIAMAYGAYNIFFPGQKDHGYRPSLEHARKERLLNCMTSTSDQRQHATHRQGESRTDTGLV